MKPWTSRRIGQPEAINFFTSEKSWAPILDSKRYDIQYINNEDSNANFSGRKVASGSEEQKYEDSKC